MLPMATSFMDSGSHLAVAVESLHDCILYYLILVCVLVLWLFARLVRSFGPHRSIVDAHTIHGKALELVWTTLPALLLIYIAWPSFRLLYFMDSLLDPRLSVKAIGSQWYWTLEYGDTVGGEPLRFDSYLSLLPSSPSSRLLPFGSIGLTPSTSIATCLGVQVDPRLLAVDNPVVLPMHCPIRLLTTATDVIHSAGVASIALKGDAIPGRLNQYSLYFTRSAKFYGQCSELCGVGHGFMPFVVISTSLADYLHWLEASSIKF